MASDVPSYGIGEPSLDQPDEGDVYETLPEFVQDSFEWHEARRNGLGASEVAAILGLSKWQTPLSVYLSKMGVPNEIDPDLAYFGHKLEPVIAQWVRDKHPEVGEVTAGFSARSVEWPWLTASPDYMIGDLPLEVKTSSAFSKDDWAGGVPLFYQTQSQTQQAVLGSDGGWLAVLHGGNSPELFWVPRDQEFIEDHLVPKSKAFWEDHVLPQIPPEPSTTAEAVSLWPGDPELKVEGGAELFELWGAYGLMQAEQIDVTERLDGIKLELQKAMQDATELTYQGRTLFTWKPRKGSTLFDADALKKDDPDLHARYMKTGNPTRTFLRKTVKEVETNGK